MELPRTERERNEIPYHGKKRKSFEKKKKIEEKQRNCEAEKSKSPFWPSIRLSHTNLPVYSVCLISSTLPAVEVLILV